MKRVFLYLATNLAVVLVLSITLRLLGVDRIHPEDFMALRKWDDRQTRYDW